jgi:PilZ domain
MARRHPVDISLDGVRIYSDQGFRIGELLTLEFILPNAPAGTVVGQVMWIRKLPSGSPARFDIGLMFRSMAPEQLHALKELLGPLEWDSSET